ncbi:MAG: dockerin type I repeat-containing protein, partial [Muribaculaceae bacterium]|nr:dockerin type I repeat-containing protein [Muribaculaceae bacterium]
ATPNLSDVLETDQMLHSSKYFAHYARQKDYDWGGMWIAHSSSKGYWFGTNTTAWNASAVAFEKPDRPYALRNIVVKYTFLRLNRPTTMRARVYRMSSIPSFVNGESVYVDPSTLELVAEGFADVDFETGTSGTASDGNAYSMGTITFPLVERDGILYYEVKPEIDFPILVVIDGYNTDDFESFSLYLSNDNIDEGYGELGYICQLDDDGNPGVIKGINYCFGGKEQYTAPSIFLDVEHPFLAFNDVYETGGRGVTENGASFDIVYYSSQPASSGWDFTEYKTESLPKWIHVTARDSTKNGEYLDKSVVTYYVDKMPSTVRGRRCVVDVHYPGVHSYFLIVQGTMPGDNLQMGDLNGDGVTNVQDVTIMIRRILGDTIYGNYYEALADLTGEGEVDVKDITALIKVILGTNVSTAPDVRIIPITKNEADELSDPIREHILVKAN